MTRARTGEPARSRVSKLPAIFCLKPSPSGFGELPDGSYGDQSGGHVALTRFNAEPSPAQAIQAYLAGLESVTVADDAEIVDSEPVAGLPSAVVETQAGLPDGREIELDVVAFGDDRGSYLIIVQHFVPPLAEPFRSIQLPTILKSVTID